MKKIHAHQLALKNIHARKIITKKIHEARKFPTPTPTPITFLMVRPNVAPRD